MFLLEGFSFIKPSKSTQTWFDVTEGIASVGLTVGDYAGNAATVVGNSIVEAAETTVDALPSEIKDAADTRLWPVFVLSLV